MPLFTGLFSKSLLIRQIRERAKRHGFLRGEVGKCKLFGDEHL